MMAVARLDELAKPAWIALIMLGFVVWWPLGLAILACWLMERKNGLLWN